MLAPPHSLHLFLRRRCWQMLAPPHSLHWLLSRWCGQMLAHPHSLLSLRRWCSQMPAPPHSLHRLVRRWCWQMPAPPHSLHGLLSRWCSQMLAPPHSLHRLLWRWCGQQHHQAVRLMQNTLVVSTNKDFMNAARLWQAQHDQHFSTNNRPEYTIALQSHRCCFPHGGQTSKLGIFGSILQLCHLHSKSGAGTVALCFWGR